MGPVPYAMFLVAMDGTELVGAKKRWLDAIAAEPDADAKDVLRNNGIKPHYRFAEIHDALNAVVHQVLPNRVLARVKRSLRREMRKPADMKIRAYYNALVKIVSTEIPHLPPFGANQTLADDELVDILLYGCPRSWTKELDKLGIDPYDHNATEIVAYLENIETSEDFEPANGKESATSSKKKGATKSSKKSEYYCLLHGKNSTHDTDECTKLKTEAKRLKGDGKTKSSGKDSGKKSNWKKKASDASDKAKSEITALVKKSVKQAVKDLKVADKKRKSSKKDDSSDEELNVIDNLAEFNYATSKLNLNDSGSDTESEVSA